MYCDIHKKKERKWLNFCGAVSDIDSPNRISHKIFLPRISGDLFPWHPSGRVGRRGGGTGRRLPRTLGRRRRVLIDQGHLGSVPAETATLAEDAARAAAGAVEAHAHCLRVVACGGLFQVGRPAVQTHLHLLIDHNERKLNHKLHLTFE
jgi:hypothetical protein